MKNVTPMGKIEMIERSQRCLIYALFGLIPVIGIPLMVRAVIEYSRVKKGWPDQWNPAKRYLFWGMVCVRIVCAMLIGITVVVVFAFVNSLQ